MKFHILAASTLCAVLVFFPNASFAQAPATPAPATADVSPVYVVTYVEARPALRHQAAALLKAYRDTSRKAPGNLRALVVQSSHRPGQFVMVSAWQNQATWDTHAAAADTMQFREKLAAMRSAPMDDRFNKPLSVGPLDDPQVQGAVYAVTHVDVIPNGKDDAVAALRLVGEANRDAAGNLRFEVVQQANRLNHFTVFEIWRSRAAFDANVMAPAQREFRDKLGLMTGALYDERLYELLN